MYCHLRSQCRNQALVLHIIAGGQTRKNELTAKCESYEPYMDEWHNEEELPRPRKDHQAVVSQGAVFVSGGVSPASNANDNVW